MKRIENPSLEWHDDQPFSKGFDDVYFSRADGLAETRLVFIEGNGLPQRWQGKKQFTIAETGFGTGLNFLATWKLFEETAEPDARLDFISFERYPLPHADLKRALSAWRLELGATYVDRLLAVYPPRHAGFHRRWITPRTTLTLIFDDALRGMRQLDCPMDAWFLDGFSPGRNQALWQQELFHEMARLSVQGTTVASFTAAGEVRRGLEQAGFAVERQPGFAHKRHRITGVYTGARIRPPRTPLQPVTIVGAGIAGAAMAFALQRRGVTCAVIEQNERAAMGASGNRLGLLNPKIEAQDNPRTDIGLSAFSFAQHILNEHGVAYTPSGALHLAFDDDKRNKLEKIYASGLFLDPHARWVDATQTKETCGLALPHDGLFYADAATIDTQATVLNLLKATTISTNTTWTDGQKDGLVILCSGLGLRTFTELPLQPVRGQVLYVDAPHALHCPVMFGNYCAPVDGATWSLGATFEQNNDQAVTTEEDNRKIMDAVSAVTGIQAFVPRRTWGQVRTASRDRYPVAGTWPNHENTWILGALGSHGLQFALLLAEILACQLTHAPLPVGFEAAHTVSTTRLWKK